MSAPLILLINPWIYDFAAYDLWVKPLGLLYIASLLRKHGCGVHLIDCLDPYHPALKQEHRIKQFSRKETGQGHFFNEEIAKPDALKNIKKKYKRYGIAPSLFDRELSALPRPAAVLITSMMTYWYPGVFEAIRRVKSVYPDVPVILGGVYATICREHARKFSGADSIVSGPGESEVLKILQALTEEKLFPVPDKWDSDTRPFPAYDLITNKKALPILTSTGCPFRCTYCASAYLNPVFKQRDPHQVVDELEFWITHEGTTDFIFYDDALLFNTEQHAIPILKEVIKRKLAVRFHCPNGLHIRYITQPVADLMMESGFKTLRLGFEFADTHLQQKTGGKVSGEEFINAARILKQAGFSSQEAGVYILAGFPGQDSKEARNTIHLVKEHGLKPIMAEYSPIPGTALWEKAVASSPFPLADEPLFHNNTLLPCQSEKFTMEDLNMLKQEARKN
ncbi:MAG: radical SAM protein [Proteobacteria bacterium]|nr:radical SAM protein [Pseudomonadota bacterium]